MKHYNKMVRQAGMTLIELTVVLLVLIGLAGLMIPYVGSFVEKTNDSTGSANLAQLNGAMGRFVAERNRLPHHMEALINNANAGATASGDCASAVLGEVFCGLADPAAFTPITYAVGTDDIALASLEKANLGMYVNNNQDAANKTFSSGTAMLYIPAVAGADSVFAGFASTPVVATAAGVAANNMLRMNLSGWLGGAGMDYFPECYDYIAMGVGDSAELVGKTITSAPVNFATDAEQGPVQNYNHYIAILQVDKSNTNGVILDGGNYTHECSSVTEAAKFVGTVLNTADGLIGVKNALQTAYENKVGA